MMDEIQFESEPSFYRICVVTVPGLFQIRNQEQCTNGKACDPHDLSYEGSYAFFGDSVTIIFALVGGLGVRQSHRNRRLLM